MARPGHEVFTTRLLELRGAVRLGSDQGQDKFVVRLVQAGRINDVGFLDSIHQLQQGYARSLQPGKVGYDVELGNLAALDGNCADPLDTIQRRLQIVRGDLPQASLRNGIFAAIIRGQCVAEDREGRERETVGGDVVPSGEATVQTLESAASVNCSVWNISTFQSKKRLISAEPRLVVLRTVSRPGTLLIASSIALGDGDLHLFDRHDAVVDANHHARKVGLWKNGDGHLECRVDPGQRQQRQEEKDGLCGAGEPERAFLPRISVCRITPCLRFSGISLRRSRADLDLGALIQPVSAGGDDGIGWAERH